MNGAVLYHSLLFNLQRAVDENDIHGATETILPLFEEHIGKSGIGRTLESVKAEDPVETLENLGELLVDSNLIGSFEVINTNTGYIFVVESCVFARKVHSVLEPSNVTCPLGLLALYLIGCKFGKGMARAISSFTDLDSETIIDFSQDFGVPAPLQSSAGRPPEEVESQASN